MAVIICPGCGAANEAGSKFCEQCGAALPAGSGQYAEQRYQSSVPPTVVKKSGGKKWLIPLIVVLVLALGGGAFAVAHFGLGSKETTKIDLVNNFDDRVLDLSGEDGQGSIDRVNMDVIKEKLAYNDQTEEIKGFIDDVVYKADKSGVDNLSNGEKVTITAEYDEKRAEDLGIEVRNGENGAVKSTIKIERLKAKTPVVQESSGTENTEPSETPSAGAYASSSIANVSASSVAKDSAKSYPASNLIDHDYKTCWAEGAKGWGEGEYVTFTFNDVVKVKGMNIANGYHKSKTLYKDNGKPAEIEIGFSDGTIQTFVLKDTMDEQTLFFEGDKQTSSVTVTIISAQPGTGEEGYDTCISEIGFF